jgi:hypothetical protein
MADMFTLTLRNSINRAALAALFILWFGSNHFGYAMRTLSFDEYATFATTIRVEKDGQPCIAPPGTVVRILGESANMGTTRQPIWIVRVIGGNCAGYETAVPEQFLKDRRPRQAPSS